MAKPRNGVSDLMIRNVMSQYSQKTESGLLGYFGLIKTCGGVSLRAGVSFRVSSPAWHKPSAASSCARGTVLNTNTCIVCTVQGEFGFRTRW
jgi:hypothetical protein